MKPVDSSAHPVWMVVCQVSGRFEDSHVGNILRGLPREPSGRRFDGGMELRFGVSAADPVAATEIAVRIVQTALSWAGLERAAAEVTVQIA